jgi:hypothetical protein
MDYYSNRDRAQYEETFKQLLSNKLIARTIIITDQHGHTTIQTVYPDEEEKISDRDDLSLSGDS